jgi:TetR/AcrR family transcriptional repressor of mexJK operon
MLEDKRGAGMIVAGTATRAPQARSTGPVATTLETRRRVRGPSKQKRRAILDAARDLFLERGFVGTSMDDVAMRAGVSKQTVYAHFLDKQRLFTELIEADVGQTEQPQHPLAATMALTDDLAGDLRAFARWHLSVVMQPHLLRMRRMLIGEAERFPELARSWYANGPEMSCRLFTSWFTALSRRGLLRVDDPAMAAEHFNWLVLSIPLNRAMSWPADHAPFSSEELDRYADEGVRVFLAAYGNSGAALRADRRSDRNPRPGKLER